MSISFTATQMDLHAKCESSYWTVCFKIREVLELEPGEFFGPSQLLEVLHKCNEEPDGQELISSNLGYSIGQLFVLLGTHLFWLRFQTALRDLREGKTSMAEVRKHRSLFVSSLDEFEKKVYLGDCVAEIPFMPPAL